MLGGGRACALRVASELLRPSAPRGCAVSTHTQRSASSLAAWSRTLLPAGSTPTLPTSSPLGARFVSQSLSNPHYTKEEDAAKLHPKDKGKQPKRRKGKPPHGTSSSTIARSYKEGEYAQALRVFKAMRNDGYIPETTIYSYALSSALKSDQHELVLEIFDDMAKNHVDFSIISYNIILNSCARAADVQPALRVLRAIRERRLEMTQATYQSLAICAGKTGEWKLALDVMNTMQEEGLEPTSIIYNSVFSACAKKDKQWETIVEVYETMPEALREDLHGVHLGAVIMAHTNSESEELKLRGLEIFFKYKARRSTDEQPSIFAYNADLLALLDTNQLEKIQPLANEMKEKEVEWDTMTYQYLILSDIRRGAVETAAQMLKENAKSMDQSTMCYRELIEFYDKKRKNPREAVRLMLQMKMNKRLSRLDWHNALRIALQLPERAPYWNFRKWMNIRAKSMIKEVPPHLMLTHPRQHRVLMQEVEKHHPRRSTCKTTPTPTHTS
ncbi:hypothetical protein PF005_g13165 [Phytophthora fragariae]|uniref:Pentatricopeptide repeat-containing protein-mitochondrial domain-containing protein n=1 Tax=Phytophthora fragariae TaxID=53985 RepID=A0A6A3KDM2_9STRA|nr:hypothetical protein PF003_g21190 [Phytophthora fragariae]KAE8936581.1 hypothetical protein PF009_g13493 [Phytophthora fragariae]KAE9005411.1 hypothetical protein PF011_g12051 [Phytophthora fragariae]KAE9106083.1 hypothetical protein PF010_g12748 [Phytophthora fragariae]KAE9106323.1 hypothetical protein PF007_g13436 [Phytophthora fragariae]